MIMKRSPRKLTLGALLGRGYFPPELPPPFRTASFAHSVRLARLASLPQELTKQKNDWCDFVSYSLARPGSLRRRLAILNPLAYFRLARFIVRHQHAILKKTGASDLSIGKPVVHLFGRLGRAVGYDAVPLRRALVRIGQRFLLVADVSRFYPSIYTHSIDWAMSSKTRAKRQLRRRSKKLSVGALLDRLVQACQSGQTRGIPIGPAVSILLSELVLARVDGRLKAQKVTTGFRYADDYELNFSDRSQAERALAALEDALAEFELELNPAKTNISELPQELDNPGIQELRRFKFRPTYQAERSDLLHFFTRAFALHRDFPDKPILRYAVSRLPASNVKAANAALMQALILQAVAYESGVWPMAIDQLLELHDAQPAVTTIDIGTTVHSMIRK
jgi:Reverse transcriptase (RNA-dependent DNA polymerase)